jgi:hypothetical protein
VALVRQDVVRPTVALHPDASMMRRRRPDPYLPSVTNSVPPLACDTPLDGGCD